MTNALIGKVNTLLVVIILSLTVRGLVMDPPNTPASDYFSTLNSHFIEYINYTSLKPPLIYLLHWLLVKIHFNSGVPIYFLTSCLAVLSSMIGLILLFKILLQFIKTEIGAGAITLVVSMALIPFEMWRNGAHYMHISFGITLFYVFSLWCFLKGKQTKDLWLLSLSVLLLFMSNSVYLIIAPIGVGAVMLFCSKSFSDLLIGIKRTALVLLIPIVFATAISAKNHYQIGVFSPSSLGGGAMSLVMMRTVDRMTDKIRPFLDEFEAPSWFKWCFDNNHIPENLKEHPVVEANSRSFGHCYNHYTPVENYDLTSIVSAIKHKAPQNVLTLIERDQNLLAEQPYLLMGFAPELSLRWNALYMKQAGQIAIKHFITYPSEYFPIFRVLANDLIYGGSKFLLNIARDSNLGSFGPLVLFSTIILAGGILYSSLLTLAAFPIMIGLLLVKIIGRRRRRKTFTINEEFVFMVTISTVALSLVLVFSTIVGEENDRYMIYIFPYLVIIATSVLSFLAERIRDHSDGKT